MQQSGPLAGISFTKTVSEGSIDDRGCLENYFIIFNLATLT